VGSGGQYRDDAVADAAPGHSAAGARVALPPLSNSFISLVKDTSLAATIQVPELFRQAQLITSRTLEVFTMYLAASLIYWVMATVLSALQNYFENQLNRQERDPK
jgi:cystine transport system permease protein